MTASDAVKPACLRRLRQTLCPRSGLTQWYGRGRGAGGPSDLWVRPSLLVCASWAAQEPVLSLQEENFKLRRRLGELEGMETPRPLISLFKMGRVPAAVPVPDTGYQDAAPIAQQFKCAKGDYMYMTRPLTAKVRRAGGEGRGTKRLEVCSGDPASCPAPCSACLVLSPPGISLFSSVLQQGGDDDRPLRQVRPL